MLNSILQCKSSKPYEQPKQQWLTIVNRQLNYCCKTRIQPRLSITFRSPPLQLQQMLTIRSDFQPDMLFYPASPYFLWKNVFQNKHRCIVIAKRSIRCTVLFPPPEDAAPESVALAQVLSFLLGQEQCLPTALSKTRDWSPVACEFPNTALIQHHPQ